MLDEKKNRLFVGIVQLSDRILENSRGSPFNNPDNLVLFDFYKNIRGDKGDSCGISIGGFRRRR